MARVVISSTEVQQAASSGHLSVPVDATVTPLARDLAAELGVRISRGGQPGAPVPADAPAQGADDLEIRVRAILASLLSGGGGGLNALTPARPPVKVARLRDARLRPFPYPGPPADMQVQTVDMVTGDDGSPITAGYMSITKGSFPWTLTYDELQVVLEGELHLGGDGGDQIGLPGDVLFVPKGSTVTFGTPTWAKFVYVTFPANWSEGLP